MIPLALVGIALEIAKLAAPKLVGALTDDVQAPAIAERVVEMAQQVTGTATPQDALAKMQADPNLLLQMNIRAQEIEAELEKAYLADRASARDRDVKLAQAGVRNRRADFMVALDVVGLVVCLVVLSLYRKDVPGEVVGILGTIAGIFGACLRDAHQFEFGSSRGSKEKDAAFMAQLSTGKR